MTRPAAPGTIGALLMTIYLADLVAGPVGPAELLGMCAEPTRASRGLCAAAPAWAASQGWPGLVPKSIAPSAPADTLDSILWRADHERGDLAEWWADDCGGEFNNGAAYTAISDEASGGAHGMLLRVPDMNTGESEGARAFRWCEAQENGALYYSAWYYIPRQVRVDDWWLLMEWKSDRSFNPKFALAVGNRRNGEMYLFVGRGADSGGGSWGQYDVNLPTRQWVHIEAFYAKATDKSGRVTVWQDGYQIVDVTNVKTADSADLGWAVLNYGQSTRPRDVTIYVDDAAISTRRLGP